MMALEWRDVDLQKRQISVERSDWKGYVPLSSTAFFSSMSAAGKPRDRRTYYDACASAGHKCAQWTRIPAGCSGICRRSAEVAPPPRCA